MKRAAALILAVLTVCLLAVADPGPATDHSQQARDLVRFGRQDLAHGLATSALVYFEQALALEPNSPEAWEGKARALDKLKRYSEARTASDKALTLAPNNPMVWAWQGKILLDSKQYAEALNALDKSLSASSDTMVWRWKGQALDSLNRHDEALNAYSKATPPEEHYRGGITRLTSGGPAAESTAHGRRAAVEENSTQAPEPSEEETTPRSGGGQEGSSSYYYEEEPQAPPVYSDNYLPGYTYYYGGDIGYGGTYGGHRKHRAYSNYYNDQYDDGSSIVSRTGGPRAVQPRVIAPYRGVEPLYHQSVVPQYFQPATPPNDFHAMPDYRGAAGDPVIGDRYNGGYDNGYNGYYHGYGNRGGRGGHGGHGGHR